MIAGLQRRTIIVLVMAALCCGLAIALGEIFQLSTASESMDLSPLLDIAELQLVGFTIFLQGETLDFERKNVQGGSWRMMAPESAPVSRMKVQQLLDLLTSQQQNKVFPVATEQLQDYGLESPFASVLLRFSDGSSHRLAFGHNNFDQSKVYVQVDGASEVRVLSSAFLEAVNRQAYEWLELEAIAEVAI